ncbi:YunC family protein [Thermoplasma volcanium]|nr:YunC family protein [Thermoplasma volcanium]
MIEIDTVNLNGKAFQFFRMGLGNAPLLILKGEHGYAMCGYLNLDAAEKLGDTAVRITGIKTLDDMLNGKIVEVTSAASALGIKKGDVLKDVLSKL